MTSIEAPKTIEMTILSRIYGHGRGWCFTPGDFTDLGSSESIRISLHRLTKKETIRRISHGFYDYPIRHEKLGILPPSPEAISDAVARRDHIRIQPSGAYVANLLGLTEQVPAKITFITEGASKTLEVGGYRMVLKKTTPKNMALSGRVSGHVVQALKYFGKNRISPNHISRLKRRLRREDKDILIRDAALTPAWIAKLIRNEIAR